MPELLVSVSVLPTTDLLNVVTAFSSTAKAVVVPKVEPTPITKSSALSSSPT